MSEMELDGAGPKRDDRRVVRTRAAIRSAFNALILSRGYDAFSAADVAEHANIGRSTFYEHYQTKDDLLARSLIPVLEPLAGACLTAAPDPSVAAVIGHFWDNRQLAKALMSGRPRAIMARQLAGLIERRLGDESPGGRFGRPAVPIPLLAVQLSHGQLALIEEWLSGRHGCSAQQIAEALRLTSAAAAHAAFIP